MVRLVKHAYGIVNPDLEDLLGVLSAILKNTTIGEARVTSFLIRKFDHFPAYEAPLTVGREGFEKFVALENPVLFTDDPILHPLRLWCILVVPLQLETPLFLFRNPTRLSNIVTRYLAPLFHID